MAIPHKPSQRRRTQLLTTLPPLPANSTQEMKDWFNDLKGAIDDDREAIEQAFRELEERVQSLEDLMQ